MRMNLPYHLLADVVLGLHFLVAVFVAAGLFAVIIGNFCKWRWVNALRFRVAHTAAIALVVVAWYCFPPDSKHRSNKGRSIQNHR